MTDTDQEKMDEVLRRMLATPPTPHKAKVNTSFDIVIRDGAMLVANICKQQGRSITADLYRNLDDYRHGRAMERGAELIVG